MDEGSECQKVRGRTASGIHCSHQTVFVIYRCFELSSPAMRFTIFVIVIVIGLFEVSCSTDSHFKVVQTAEGTSDRLTPQEPVPILQEGSTDPQEYTLDIDVNQRYQKIRGFGGAFTDSTAFNFMQLPQDKQEQILESYFGSSGHGYSICRLQMGSSDFAISHYNYANETDDFALKSFSIEHDLEYIIPMIQMAQKVAAKIGIELQFVATPWSPPAWMKRTNRMQNSLMPGLRQEKEIFQAWHCT